MIGGATRGAGGQTLARHLASKTKNESVEVGPSRGLVSDPADIRALERELERVQTHVRTTRPIHHVHCDPPKGLSLEKQKAVEDHYWAEYEKEFGLQRQPFYSVIHTKNGRRHVHRAYGLGRADGSVVDLSFDFARREKVARIVEFDEGLRFTRGAHNRAVVAALQKDGRQDVAAALERAGLLRGPRPRAPSTPAERAREERAGRSLGVIRDEIWEAWRASDDAESFQAALAESGLQLALGRKTVQIIDSAGNSYDLRRQLSMRARVDGQRVTIKDIRARLGGLQLPSVEAARRIVRHRADTALHFAAPGAHGAKTLGKQPDSGRRAERTRQQISSPHASAGGGASSAQPPAAYDPAKPGDWERYCRELAHYWIQREIETEAASRGGHHAAEIRYGFTDERIKALDLESIRRRRTDLWGHGRPENPGSSSDQRFPRNGSDHVCDTQDSHDRGGTDAAPLAAGSAGWNGSVGNRSTARASGENRRIPGSLRTDIGRYRVEAWRQSRAIVEAAARWQGRFRELTETLEMPAATETEEIETGIGPRP